MEAFEMLAARKLKFVSRRTNFGFLLSINLAQNLFHVEANRHHFLIPLELCLDRGSIK